MGSFARIVASRLAVQLRSLGPRRATPTRGRPWWWTLHSWVGLCLSLLLAFIFATGTLAVFANEIDWLAAPEMRAGSQAAVPSAVGAADPGVPASWGTLVAAAATVVPGGRVVSVYAPSSPGFAAIALVETRREESLRVLLDPMSGAVQGVTGWVSVQQIVRQLHRRLMLPSPYGVPLVTFAAAFIIVSLVTGLAAYKRFWRGFLQRPRGGNGRRLAGDLHRLAGVWSLWFLTLVGATGSWYLVDALGGGAALGKLAHPPSTPPALAKDPDGPAIDRLAAAAHAAYPALTIRAVQLPAMRGDVIAFMGQADAVLVRDRANAVWLDPTTREVLQIDRGEELSLHRRIAEMADPLHFGVWGGLASRLVWFCFGLVLTALPVSGVVVYSLRLSAGWRAAPQPAGAIGRCMRALGPWAYIAGALLANAVVLAALAVLG
jgi:uncharacterized iron-regulated membrane protein